MKKKKTSKSSLSPRLSRIILGIFFGGVGLLYLHNLTRDIYSGDIGDLVTASYVFGVAHPPGYPLFTFLGYLFSHIPLLLPVVTKVALISTIASVIGLWYFYRYTFMVIKNMYLALITTSILAFSYLFWFHAVIPETFGLNNLIAILILFYAYRFHAEKRITDLYILAVICGISLTHHHTILFLFPGIAILLLSHLRFIWEKKRQLPVAFGFFFLGLIPYIYVPLAAMQGPVINWDNASNVNNFLHLLLRKDYGFAPSVTNEVPISVKMIHVKSFLQSLANSYSYQILGVAILGWLGLVRRDRWFFLCLTICFVLTGPFFMYYAAGLTGIPVGMGIIERFYVLPSVVCMFFVPFGFSLIYNFLNTKFSRPILSLAILSYFLLFPFMLLYYNFPRTDLSRTTIGNTLVDNIFSYLPKNAVLFVSGDTTTFNVWYNHYVLKKRPDIDIINPPGVGANIYFENEVNDYHKKHPSVPLDKLASLTIEDIRSRRKLFSTYPIELMPSGTVLLPRGLVYEIASASSLPTYEVYLFEFEQHQRQLKITRKETASPAEDNLVAAEIPSIYASGLVRIADFVDSHYKDPAKAEHYYRRALWIDPDHPNANSGLALSQYKAYKDCENAAMNMRTAITIYPVWRTYYAQLYLIYEGCNAPQKVLTALAKEYQTLFHADIRDLAHPTQKR